MPVKLVTPPVAEPLTLLQVKKHLRLIVEDTDVYSREDDLLSVMIIAARQMVEEILNRKLMPAVYDCLLGAKELQGSLQLPLSPIRAVTAVNYFNESGVSTVLDPAYYSFADYLDNDTLDFLDSAYAFRLSSTKSYAVVVRVSVGYASAADIPRPIIQAMLLMIGYWYENREDSVRKMPVASDYLLMPFRIITFS